MSDTVFTVRQDELKVQMTRTFDALPERVFKAFIDSDLISQWWGPRGTTTVVDKNEVKPGGVWRFIVRGSDGKEAAFNGRYIDIEPHKSITHTFNYEPIGPGHELKETATFEPAGDGRTRLTTTSYYDKIEELEGMVESGMEKGARETYDRLAELLEATKQERRLGTVNGRPSMRKLATCLWFDGQAEEAANFYTSIFKNSKILKTSYYWKSAPMPEGTVLTVDFEIEGAKFTALNGGPHFKFTEAISFMKHCETQEEIDYYWEKLTDGGEESMCGWLKDKYGVCWQIIPSNLDEHVFGPDPSGSQRAMEAMLKMRKLDIRTLKKAYENG